MRFHCGGKHLPHEPDAFHTIARGEKRVNQIHLKEQEGKKNIVACKLLMGRFPEYTAESPAR
uniref:Uncharacterized protein n=1 Tax=Anguilla anguilla TaxID=7936 RepID=A0A0E9RE68_ANGAN